MMSASVLGHLLIREIVVREHQGQLLFEGSRRGAVFTVVLPPFNG
jgi:signal transduction histidine kinase